MNYEILLRYKPTLAGTVVEDTGKPLEGAKVRVRLQAEKEGQENKPEALKKYDIVAEYNLESDEKGVFSLRFDEAEKIFSTHRIQVRVYKEDYSFEYRTLREIHYSGLNDLETIELQREKASVSGRIVDEERKPIKGATVMFRKSEGEHYTNLRFMKTGEDGRFELKLAWGWQLLDVSAEGYESLDGIKEGLIYAITENKDLGDFVLKAKEREGIVTGQILDLNGNPAAHVRVNFREPTLGKDSYSVTTDSNGCYEIRLPSRSWMMSTTGGYDLPYYRQQGQITGDRTWDADMRDSLISTDLLWKPRYDANGNRAEARDVSFKPGDRIQVSLSVPGSKTPVSLGVGTSKVPIYDNKGNIIGYGEATVTINEDGTVSVHLEGVRSGKYEVEITHPTYGTGKLTYDNLTGLPRENYLYMSQNKPQTSPSPKATVTPTVKPTATPSPKATTSPTATPTPKATASPTATSTPKATVTPTATPTIEPSPTPTVKPIPTVTPRVTPSPSPTPSVTPTVSPAVSPAA